MSYNELIKAYNNVCLTLEKDKSEDNKQHYLIMFNELELLSNKKFKKTISKLDYTSNSLNKEIERIEKIIDTIKNRRELRTKMEDDYIKYIGYRPLELSDIGDVSEEKYVANKTNLIVGNEIISDLIKSGQELKYVKDAFKANPSNHELELKIDELKDYRNGKYRELKNSQNVINDLYEYVLKSPKNRENIYIEYVLLKVNPNLKK